MTKVSTTGWTSKIARTLFLRFSGKLMAARNPIVASAKSQNGITLTANWIAFGPLEIINRSS
jgi:hypothetical protein